MKWHLPFLLILFILFITSCNSVNTQKKNSMAVKNSSEEVYDSVLAKQYGADNYGMKQYVLAYLKRGPVRSQDSVEAAALQKAHLENIERLAEEGLLVLAGPFLDDGDVRGIYIFNVSTIEEARELTATDPSIQQGRLEMELHPWYGSAALMGINDLHKKVTKTGITD